MWRRKAVPELLQPLVTDVERKLTRHHPGYRAMSDEEQRELLAAYAGDDTERVRIAMNGALPPSRSGFGGSNAEFVHTVRALERVRRAL